MRHRQFEVETVLLINGRHMIALRRLPLPEADHEKRWSAPELSGLILPAASKPSFFILLQSQAPKTI